MLQRSARVREPASPRSFLGHAIAKLWLVRAYSSSIWGSSAWRKQAQRVLLRLSWLACKLSSETAEYLIVPETVGIAKVVKTFH